MVAMESVMQLHVGTLTTLVPVLDELVDLFFQHIAFKAKLYKIHMNLSVRFDPSSADGRFQSKPGFRADRTQVKATSVEDFKLAVKRIP